jgi:hypothetical protein
MISGVSRNGHVICTVNPLQNQEIPHLCIYAMRKGYHDGIAPRSSTRPGNDDFAKKKKKEKEEEDQQQVCSYLLELLRLRECIATRDRLFVRVVDCPQLSHRSQQIKKILYACVEDEEAVSHTCASCGFS